jgi:hypothetical protein
MASAETGFWVKTFELYDLTGTTYLELDERQSISHQLAQCQERFAEQGYIEALDPLRGELIEVPYWETQLQYSCDYCEAERLAQCSQEPLPPISDKCQHCFPYLDPCAGPGAEADCKIVVVCVPHPDGGWTCWIGCGTEV